MKKKASPSALGKLLGETRLRKGWSQSELARLGFVSTRTITALEKGDAQQVRVDAVIRLAFALGENVSDWVKIAGYEFDAEKVDRIKEEVKASKPLDDLQEFGALETEAEKARVHFILTFRPAETTVSSKAEKLREEMVKKLGLLSAVDGSCSGPSEKVVYIFCFPNVLVAEELWSKLYQYIAEQKTDDNIAESTLKRIHDEKRLVTLVVPPCLCVHPTVVFDPESPSRRGFVLYYHPQNCISVARMSTESLQEWYDEVFLPIIRGQDVNQLTWESIHHALKQGIKL